MRYNKYVSSIFRKKVCFHVTLENAKTQTHEDWQRLAGRRARNGETPTTITVHSIPRNDHFPLTGGPEVLTTDDVGCFCVQLSVMYSGAVPWRHRYTVTASLNCVRSATSSQ